MVILNAHDGPGVVPGLRTMIAGFRSADGMRIGQQAKRNLSWHEREDGMIDIRARLPKEEAALLLAAIAAAKDQFGPSQPNLTRVVRSQRRRRMPVGTAMWTPCWMWPGCF